MKKLLLIIIVSVLVTACSPRVTSKFTKQYEQLNSNTEVAVLNVGSPIPEKAELLGNISVKDGGATTKCDSLTMINLVKNEARGAGANVVLLTDCDKPSFKSSCWQFEGLALRADNLNVADRRSGFDTIKIFEEKKDHYPFFSLGVNVGGGWRLNKLAPSLDAVLREAYTNLRFGLNYNVMADFYFSRNYGLRLLYSGIRSSSDTPVVNIATGEGGTFATNHSVTYFGISFAGRDISKNKKWIFDTSIGLGYMGYEEHITVSPDFLTTTGGTLGAEYNFGVKYCFTENLSVGLNLSYLSGVLYSVKQNENGHIRTIVAEPGEGEGLSYFNILVGLTYSISKK